MMLYYIQERTACGTINVKYFGITRIGEAQDGGLSISYVYIMYKTIDS